MKVKDILKNCSEWIPSKDYHSVTPVVSVLLPTFKRAKNGLFEVAVQSVLNQDFKNLELIIIDDGSTDGTADLIDYFMKIDSRVSCIRHQFNVGLPAISEYEGYMKAHGEYIAFIFDDNKWERDYLDKTISFMVRNQAKAAYGKVRSYHGTGSEFLELGVSLSGVGIHSLPYTNFIANGGVVLSREVIESIGLYDPHVSMTRLCDWNLWKRIIKKYEFFETGIETGIETGQIQSDSLGNTYQMNSWVVAERESQCKNEMFLPSVFEDIDITMVMPCSSDFYCQYIQILYEKFEQKDWFVKEKIKLSIDKPLRLLILANSYDATIGLSFLRMYEEKKSGIIFKFGGLYTSINELIQADAVIIIRNVIALDGMKNICNKLGIPCYLYMDDNFIVLANENKKDAYYQQLAKMLRYDSLKNYSGLMLSNKLLERYFRKYELNIPIMTLHPCIGQRVAEECNQKDCEYYVMAYMGGSFRDGVFLNCVMPALSSLAQHNYIKLICPSRLNLTLYKNIKNLEIVQIDVCLSLDQTLIKYGAHRPQFLLHCGPEIQNNQYKTENALINAVQLGSILVTSNNEPYKTLDRIFCVCTKNTIEAWRTTLTVLIQDQKLRNDLYKKAEQRCNTMYAAQHALDALIDGLSDLNPFSLAEIIQRNDAVIYDLQYTHSMNTLTVATVNSRPTRALGQIPLSYTDGIVGQRHYQIQCTSDTFSELGICFASYGEPHGKIVVSIYSSKCKLRECVLSMEDFVHDNWTYLEFQPIDNPKNQIFNIVLDFQYNDISAQMGVFEDASKRSFAYRVLNKLGYRMNVRDLLFVDCR